MSIKYLNWAWNQNLDTPLQKLILVKLGDNADDSGRAFPSLVHIAKFTSCNEKTVRRNITSLEQLNLLTVYKVPARAGNMRNEYLLHIEVVLNFDHVPDTESTTGQRVHQLPDTKSTGYRSESPDNPQSLTTSNNHHNTNSVIDDLFEQFWSAGMVKVNKKKALTVFRAVMKKQRAPKEFTTYLIDDVKCRIFNNQFGFNKLHPERYLKNERYNDDIQTNTPVNQSVEEINSGDDWYQEMKL